MSGELIAGLLVSGTWAAIAYAIFDGFAVRREMRTRIERIEDRAYDLDKAFKAFQASQKLVRTSPDYSVIDTGTLRTVIGWREEFTLPETIEQILAHLNVDLARERAVSTTKLVEKS